MTRLQVLLEAIGQAMCEKGRRALQGQLPFGDVMPEVARTTLAHIQKHLPSDEIRLALAETAAAKPDQYTAALTAMIDGLARVQSVPFKTELADYLRPLPATIRHMFRRPADPTGRTAPEKIEFYKPENLLVFLPPRPPKFKPGDAPAHLDGWKLDELRGIGECGEVWTGHRDGDDHGPAALKFAIDGESKERLIASQELFVKAFELNEVNGVVPLRSVFLDSDPPCLESAFVFGYDLSGLMHEWAWRFDQPKPEAALKLVRRVTDIVAKAHAKRMVHRDLKPSNVLVHPTEGGKFTVWVTDFGWGQIEAVRSVELARGGTPRGEQTRLSHHGAYTPLYASPQQQKKEAADPRDDVHALGVIWYQLLKRDPHAAAPVGTEWAEEMLAFGFTDAQVRLLSACLATRPEKRPSDCQALAELMHDPGLTAGARVPAAVDDGSKLISLRPQSGSSSSHHAVVASARGKAIQQDGAAMAAASLLGGSGGAHRSGQNPTAAGLSSTTGLPKLVRNVLGMTFAHIAPGTFQMGSPDGEAGRRPDEGPRHTVRLTKPFYLSLFPVTQGQFEKVVGKNPAYFHRSAGGGPDLPVENVSWYDAERFCQKLARLGEEKELGRTYRLPTEAEWEYACRAGATTAYWNGDKLTPRDGAFGGGQAGVQKPDPVGQHGANAFGVYDLHGNVGEWVNDWYDEYYYFDTPGNDPPGPAHGELKVVRGGGWASAVADCRSAARKALHPDKPNNAVGFRVVLVVDAK